MKPNLFGVAATDVMATQTLVESGFGLEGIGRNDRKMTHLHAENGSRRSLIAGGQVGEVHIGLIRETEAQVNATSDRLRADGCRIDPPQRSHGWRPDVTALGGLIVEVVG